MKLSRLGFLLALAFGPSLMAPAQVRAGALALMVDVGLRSLSNSPDTEKAIFGQKQGIGAGLGLSYDHGSHWRFGADVRRIKREGERAFAADRTSEAFRLGHPLTLTMTQSLASVAFRFGQIGPVSPYIAVGGGVLSWREQSNIAGLIEKANGSAGLFEARLGVERAQGPVRIAVEGGLTFASNAVGVGGISKVYEEDDLGGLFVVVRLGFARK